MFCKRCGKKIDADSDFCSYCGTKQFSKDLAERNQYKSKDQDTSLITGNLNTNIGRSKPVNLQVEKYDMTYKNETGATITGVILAVIFMTVYLINEFSPQSQSTQSRYFLIIFTFSVIVLRIFSIIKVTEIARRQNRKVVAWGILTFFFPIPSLIIIGLLKKLKLQIGNPSPNSSEVLQNNSDKSKSEISQKVQVNLSTLTGMPWWLIWFLILGIVISIVCMIFDT